jgi:hypothetical protein
VDDGHQKHGVHMWPWNTVGSGWSGRGVVMVPMGDTHDEDVDVWCNWQCDAKPRPLIFRCTSDSPILW